MRKWQIDTLHPRGFSRPSGVEEWVARVRANAATFGAIYAGTSVALSTGIILSNPLSAVWWSVFAVVLGFTVRSQYIDEVWTVHGTTLAKRQQALVLGPLLVAVVVFGGLLPTFLWIIAVSSLVSGAHASLRSAPTLDEPPFHPALDSAVASPHVTLEV